MMSSILEYISMNMRGTPVSKIKKHRTRLREAGYDIANRDLESHFLAGGRLDELTSLLVLSKEAEKELNFQAACAIDLMTQARGESALPCLERSLELKTFVFDTFAIDEVSIVGITLEKEKLTGSIRFDYHYPVTAFPIDESFPNLRNRLGAAISAEIHASLNMITLMEKLPEISAILKRIAIESMSTITDLKIEIKRV